MQVVLDITPVIPGDLDGYPCLKRVAGARESLAVGGDHPGQRGLERGVLVPRAHHDRQHRRR